MAREAETPSLRNARMQSARRARLEDFMISCLMASTPATASTQRKAAARLLISSALQVVSWARAVTFAVEDFALSNTALTNSKAVKSDLGSPSFHTKNWWIATHCLISTCVV